MRGTNIEYHADGRGSNGGQVADMTDAAGRHFGNQEASVLIAAQSGIRQADLVIKGAGRSDGVTLSAENRGQ